MYSVASLKTPVVANVTARSYKDTEVAELLVKQISASVLWSESVCYLMGEGEMTFVEMGDNPILTRMIAGIQKHLV